MSSTRIGASCGRGISRAMNASCSTRSGSRASAFSTQACAYSRLCQSWMPYSRTAMRTLLLLVQRRGAHVAVHRLVAAPQVHEPVADAELESQLLGLAVGGVEVLV